MNTLIQILGVMSGISLILALNLVTRHYKWWLFYAATNILFITVQLITDPPVYGTAVMGVILIITGIKNYLVGRKKERSDETSNSIS